MLVAAAASALTFLVIIFVLSLLATPFVLEQIKPSSLYMSLLGWSGYSIFVAGILLSGLLESAWPFCLCFALALELGLLALWFFPYGDDEDGGGGHDDGDDDALPPAPPGWWEGFERGFRRETSRRPVVK